MLHVNRRERESALGMLRSRAEADGGKTAFILLNDKIAEADRRTFGELFGRACGIARLLRGVFPPGARLILAYPPGLDFIDAFFGCIFARIIAVPLPVPRLRRPDGRFQNAALNCGASGCLTLKELRDGIHESHGRMGQAFKTVSTDEIAEDTTTDPTACRSDDIAYLQYTSGSTGYPRGAVISHRNIMSNLEMIRRGFSLTPEDCTVSWLPHFHDMGLVGDTLTPIYCGMSCIKMSAQTFMREPLSWLRTVKQYHATNIGAPGFAYDLCTRAAEGNDSYDLDLSSLENAYCGSETIKPEVARRFVETFSPMGLRPNAFRPSYGLAEATLCVTVGERLSPVKLRSRPDHPESSAAQSVIGCGVAVPGCIVRVRTEEGPAAEGQIGEITVAGPHVSPGYWGEIPVRDGTVSAAVNRVLATGDLGFLRDGELYITGRKKDMMIVGGRNLYPLDIESTAARFDSCIQACVAFSIDSAEGERVILFAEVNRAYRKRDLTALRESLLWEVLQEHDVALADVVLLKPHSFPRTTSGKPQRFACREQYLSKGVVGMLQSSKLSSPGHSSAKGRSNLVTDYIRQWASDHLGVEPASITGSSRLSDLGLDSLRAVDLQLSLARDCGLSVPPSAFADGVDVAELARRSLRFATPDGPPIAVIPTHETVDLRFNVMPGRFVREVLFTKEYRIWPGYAEAIFDRDYKSEMLASPDHLVFLTALSHTQKLAYVCMAHELGLTPDLREQESFKFWPTDVRITMPQMITENTDLRQQLWVFDKRPVSENKYQVKCRTLIGSMEITIESTMLLLEKVAC